MAERENTLPDPPRRWTTEEIEYLKENVGYRKLKDIADTLGRTETAVTLKMKRLGIGMTRSLAGKITSGELAQLLGIERNTVKGWIEQHNLPSTRKITSKKRKYTLIRPESFWKWAEENKHRIDFNKMEKNSLPPEPDWVSEERKNPSFQKRNYQEWSTQEDKLLASYIDEGLPYRDIAEKMNRSHHSVERRYKRIRELADYYSGEKPYAIKPGERLSLRKDTRSD